MENVQFWSISSSTFNTDRSKIRVLFLTVPWLDSLPMFCTVGYKKFSHLQTLSFTDSISTISKQQFNRNKNLDLYFITIVWVLLIVVIKYVNEYK